MTCGLLLFIVCNRITLFEFRIFTRHLLMDPDFPSPGGINGINLTNYFPNQRSNNTVVYYHKKLLPNTQQEKVKDIKKDQKPDKTKCKKKKSSNKVKNDKSQQFNSDTVNQQTFKYETLNIAPYNSSVLEPTIRFAKTFVPLVIPPLREVSSSPVVYTVKTSRKHKKPDKRHECSIEQDATYNKDHEKKTDANKKRKRHKENYSARESIDPSSQNTLEDVHININQSCSFSESTEVKFHKKVPSNCKISNENSQKFFVSNSFEAFANESVSDGNKIKIHLMNDSDKVQFMESIRNPIVSSIKEYLSQFNNKNLSTDLIAVQKFLRTNNEKLDDVLERLSCIEKKIDTHAKQINQTPITPRMHSNRASKLEELGQDIIEVREHDETEEDLSEEYNKFLNRRRNRGKSVVVSIDPKVQAEKNEKNRDILGCGEDIPGPVTETSSASQLGVKLKRPNRIPARFCWTDADKKK